MSVEVRAQLPGARRVVVKVGSSSISGENAGKIQLIVEALAEAHGRGTEVVLVSSGAIATGMPYLALDERPLGGGVGDRHDLAAGPALCRPQAQ